MLKMNAESAQAVADMIDAAQQNLDRLINVTAGVGANLDVTV
jgi:hypothetical protein